MTINEIAKLAGVSRATVSRYLNNGYVSQEKKEIIQKVMADTGYQPSIMAQNLRGKTTKFIGVIIPKINSDSISRMVYGIGEVLSANGYQILLGNTNNQEQEELKFLQLFRENQVDGVILIGTIFTNKHKKLLQSLNVPLVIAAQRLEGFSCVYSDDYSAAYETTTLLAKTAANLGYLGVTTKDQAVGQARKQGFLDAIRDAGLTVPDHAMIESTFAMDSAYQKTQQLFEANPKIDSLFCATDTIAIGALQYLKKAGYRIPEQVQLNGMGDGVYSHVCEPALTTVHFHYKTIGVEAAKLLLEQLSPQSGDIHKEIKLGYQVIQRESTRN